MHKREDGEDSVESVVHGKKIVATEQIIHELLQINDQSGFLTEIFMGQTEENIEKMGYEGVFPPTVKRL